MCIRDSGKPGVIFVGVNDDGTRASLGITDELLKQLSDLGMSGQIQPLPSMTVQKRKLCGWELCVIVIQPSPFPPVRYDGRAYVRVGPTTRPASAADERRLLEKRRSHNIPFDISPAPMATVADLDLALFLRVYLPAAVAPDVVVQNERTLEQQLASLRLLSLDGTPTILGVLAVGKDPRGFVPGSYIQFVRIEGTEITDAIIRDQKEIAGPLPDLLRRLDEVIEAHISVESDFTSQPTEVQRPDYPVVALQQIVRNAILHRTYEGTNAPVRMTWFTDRIEVLSPGGPYGQVTPESFGRPGVTDYRNPHIAEAMKVLGYAQRFGFGIAIARQELAKNGNPPIAFTVTDTHVLAVLRRRS